MDSILLILHPVHQVDPKLLNIAVLKKTLSKFLPAKEYVKRKPNGNIGVYRTPGHKAIDEMKKITEINVVSIQVKVPEEAYLTKGVISHPDIKLQNEDIKELLQG